MPCGELEEFEGIFRKIRGQDPGIILLEMLIRQVAATVPLAALKAI